MEIRKGISSVVLIVIVCLSALFSFASRAQTLSYAYVHNFPNSFSQADIDTIDLYSIDLLKTASSSIPLEAKHALEHEPREPQVLFNLIRDDKNEQDYYWVSPLFAFDCEVGMTCTPNAGGPSASIAVSYIAIDKTKVSFEYAERLSELVGQYKSTSEFSTQAQEIKDSLKKSFPSAEVTHGIISFAGRLHADANDLWIIADIVPLFSERGERGELKGIAADLVQDVLDKMALSQEILSAPWERIAKESMSKSNVLVFSIIRTDERDEVFHWITPVSRNMHGLYGINKPYFDSFDEVPRTYRVGTLLADYRYDVAISKGFRVKAYDSWQALVTALINNEIDTVFGSQGAIEFGCNPNQFKCETITLTSKYDTSTAYLALSKKDTCVLVLEKLKLAAAEVKMSEKFNERLSSWSDMVSQEYGIAHHTERGVVHLWNPN
ncbi:substrate-binding periplasmic protein [Alteromonas gracilis]|uniref:substrate-binding periplasmic protein n=1 Tax=Alteromonas gracilis TaxID=1479524 RepID=UPI0037368293